ncbi:MAG: tetratricopeptide repeat protein [Nitrospira sp.]|nr:MAG: tetratricopeptide repeat protein [Nitrospira sp.]
MRIRTSCIQILLCVLAQSLVTHNVCATELPEPQAASLSIPATPLQTTVAIPSSRIALPDDGPRYDRTIEGPGTLQFQEAVKAFTRGQYAVARAGFDALAGLDSASALAPPLKAFLAELTLAENSTDYGRREAIALYRSVIGSYPDDANSYRALWRVGDLYAAMGWFKEAVVAYEYALSRELPRHDEDRSLLALGITLGELGRWTEAEQAFDTVRKRAMDDRFAVRATFEQANALYAQRRKRDALPLYDHLHRLWPSLLKQNPQALQQYGDALFAVQELKRACEIDLLLYNLFPSYRDVGMALVRLGDSHSRLGMPTSGELFYTVAKTQYADTAAGAVARMRLSRRELDIAVSAGEDLLRKKVEGLIRGAGASYLDPSEGEALHKTIALEHQSDVLGSEALFHLAEHYELRGNTATALRVYQDVTRRIGAITDDPWPQTAGVYLASILKPQLEAALTDKDQVQALTLFYSHGQAPEQYYLGTQTLLTVADTHRRLGFSSEAIHLYQTFMRNRKAATLHEAALIGLGESYLDQSDPTAARNVFESFRLQYPRSSQTARVSQRLTKAMLEQGDRRNAIRVMQHWTKGHPQDAAQGWVSVTLARTLAEDQKPDEAASAFERAWRDGALRAPQDLLLYADLLVTLNKSERAVDFYRQALKSEPNSSEAEWARVQIMLNPGVENPKEAGSQAVASDTHFDDPLFHRAANAIPVGFQAANEKEGE